MSAIEKEGIHQLFEDLQAQGGVWEVRMAIFEIAGKKCFDLLQSGHKEIVLKVNSHRTDWIRAKMSFAVVTAGPVVSGAGVFSAERPLRTGPDARREEL